MQPRWALGGFAQHDLRTQFPAWHKPSSQCPTGHDSSVLKMYFLPSPQLGVCFQKSTGDRDFKGNTFPSNLRTSPLPVLIFGKQNQSKAKTCYLLIIFYGKTSPGNDRELPQPSQKGKAAQRSGPCWVVCRDRFHISPRKRFHISPRFPT